MFRSRFGWQLAIFTLLAAWSTLAAGANQARAQTGSGSLFSPPPLVPPREDHVPTDRVMSIGTFFSVGLGVPAIAMNLHPRATPAEQRPLTALALAVGVQGMTLGLMDVLHDGSARASGCVQLAVGATALTLGVRNHFRVRSPSPEASRPQGASPANELRPVALVRAGPSGEPQFGVAVRF